MATSKTIKPTNQTVSIPAMTDVPDQSVNSNAISKAIDGINAIQDRTAKFYVDGVETASGGVKTFSALGNGNYLIIFYAGHMSSLFLGGSSTSLYIGGDNPTDYGFTITRNDTEFTLTRTNGTDFQFAKLEID